MRGFLILVLFVLDYSVVSTPDISFACIFTGNLWTLVTKDFWHLLNDQSSLVHHHEVLVASALREHNKRSRSKFHWEDGK